MLPRYNYHTHTLMCGHAAFVDNLEYIEKYINNGFSDIGISDHMPNTKYQLPDERFRMDISQFNDYIKGIKKLKKHYKNINILTGLECEYSKILGRHLCNIKKNCDYLILGQHDIENVNPIGNYEYPLIYASRICEALDTGLFDYIAHPDYFLKYRDTINDEDRNIYINNCKECFRRICNKAKILNIPLEINLTFINNVKIMNDNQYPYPHSLLFNIAHTNKNRCVVGIDAHNPNIIDKYINSYNKILRDLPKLDIIYDYNPIKYRNKVLDKRYDIYRKNIKCFEYYYVKSILNKLSYNSSNDEIIKYIYKYRDKLTNKKTEISNKLLLEIDTINNSILDLNEKKHLINRKNKFIKLTYKRYKEQDRLLINIIKFINKNKDKFQGKKLIKRIKEYYCSLK